MNTYFKELVNERACHAQDIVLFADEATSAARKEMIGIILMKIQVLLSCLDDLQPHHLVKAAVTHWLLHGQTCKRVRE